MKYYFLFFFIFCLIVGGGIYTLNPSSISVDLFSYSLSLPLSLWILGSVSIFFAISICFFTNHWIRKLLSTRRQEKDLDSLVNQIQDQILQKTSHPSYRTQPFQMLSKILQKLKIEPIFESQPSQNAPIDELFSSLKSLQNGEVIKNPLQANTPFWIQNTQNRINTDLKFAQKVIEGDYDASLKQNATIQLIQNESLNEKMIQKIIQQELDSKSAKIILEHFLDKGYKLGQAELIELLNHLESPSLIAFFQKYKHCFDPDFCIELFSNLVERNENAKNAYAYILIDFSMFDKAKEFLRDHEDLILPRAYIDLKESGKNYPFDKFFG